MWCIYIDNNDDPVWPSGYYNIDDGESRINSYIYDLDPVKGTQFKKLEAEEILRDMRRLDYNARLVRSKTSTRTGAKC